MSSQNFIQRLQHKWGFKSSFQVILVLVVFALTGSTIAYIKDPVLQLLGLENAGPSWLRTTLYFVFVLPLYQLVLLIYGTMFGLFSFFWEKEKRLFRLMARPFMRRKA